MSSISRCVGLVTFFCLIGLAYTFAPKTCTRIIAQSRFPRRPGGETSNPTAGVGPSLRSRSSHEYLSCVWLQTRKSSTEIGIQTAQLLLDKRRHAQLQEDLSRQFPLIPKTFIDGCVKVVADAFSTVAPAKLQQALQPGGMQQVRPEVCRTVSDFVLQQPIVEAIPVWNDKERRRLVETLVAMAMDFALRDAQVILAAPEVRLEALQEEVRKVRQMMGPWRLLWYRMRRLPRGVKLGGIVAVSMAMVYQQQGACDLAALCRTGKSLYSVALALCIQIVQAGSTLGFLLKSKTEWLLKAGKAMCT